MLVEVDLTMGAPSASGSLFALSGREYTIRNAATQDPVPIYSDLDGTPLANPVIAVNGELRFFVEEGQTLERVDGETGLVRTFFVSGPDAYRESNRRPRIVGLGASYTSANGAGTDISVMGYLPWAMLLSGGKLKYAGHYGLGGAKAEDLLASGLDVILNYSPVPRYCVVDVLTNNMSDVDLTSGFEAFLAILAALRDRGIDPVVTNIPPRDGGTATQYANIARANVWLARRAELDGFKLVDWYSRLVNPATGTFAAGMLLPGDGTGLHVSAAGAKKIGQAIVDTLQHELGDWSPRLRADDVNTVDLVPKGCFITDAGGGRPSGYTELSATTGTDYNLISDANIVGNWFETKQTGTGLTMIVGPTVSDLVPGHRVRWSGRFKTVSLAAGCTINVYVGGTGGAPIGTNEATFIGWHSEDVEGIFELDFLVPPGVTTAYLVVKVQGAAGTVRIAQQSLIDLTLLPLGVD